MKCYAITHKGLVRESNEDCCFIPERGENFAVVCDGMGGHLAGEVASRMAIEAVQRMARENERPGIAALREAVACAHETILAHAQDHIECAGMGTTLSVLWLGENYAYIAHVGDSRIYRLREGSLTQITQDHSLVEELVRAGLITREQARTHPRRNIITRALGTHGENEPDMLVTDVQDGDVFLLCTDGLTGMVPDDEIERTLRDCGIEAAADRLLALALDAGGRDNVTLILCARKGAGAWNRD